MTVTYDRAMEGGMEAWLERAVTAAYWAELNPDLAIGGAPVAPLFTVDDERRNEILGDLLRDGYVELPPTLPPDRVARMAEGTMRLRRAHIPPVFMYVYDDFHNLAGWIDALLATVLGAGYRALPNVWAWCVEPTGMDSGWPPHRDSGFDSLTTHGLPRTLTVWVPLTDATPLNGCMYCVPAERDPHYRARRPDTTVVDLQDVRALPVAAGSVLAWNHALLHWGGRGSDRAATPRISLSVEFQRADEPFEGPTLDPRVAPPFERRLGLIAHQLLQYRHMTTEADPFETVAARLEERFPL